LVESPSLVDDVSAAFPTSLRRARKDVCEYYGLDVDFDDRLAWNYLVDLLYESLEDFEKRDADRLHRAVDRLKAKVDLRV
jgi:hypothetical protein